MPTKQDRKRAATAGLAPEEPKTRGELTDELIRRTYDSLYQQAMQAQHHREHIGVLATALGRRAGDVRRAVADGGIPQGMDVSMCVEQSADLRKAMVDYHASQERVSDYRALLRALLEVAELPVHDVVRAAANTPEGS